MKTKVKTIVISIFVCALASCSKYGNVMLNYPAPPLKVLPPDIHYMAVINRTMPPLESKKNWGTLLGKIWEGKILGSDKLASDDAIKGVFDKINGWRGLSIVIPSQTRYVGTGTNQTPEPMGWDLVKQICDSNRADVLLVLEMFDQRSNLVGNVINTGINMLEHGGGMPSGIGMVRVNVTCFWRLYDPFQKRIIDEYETSNFVDFNNGGGVVPMPPPNGLQQVARAAGVEYIQRFLPSFYRVSRTMYKRGRGKRQQFLAAFRHSEVADWQGALPIWQQLAQNCRRVNAGRACLDIAVAYEVLGDINEAMKWASKGYEDYRNKICRDYRNTLAYRLKLGY
ncbi:MAG: hypothetical protein JST67_02905 [Bacteroidetes bacterium]|nr:hypothetical protein [Bacteroidota bacterium]